MDLQAAIEFLSKEGRVILQAPVTFGVAACALMLGAWAVSNYAYATRIENLEGRMKLKDDQIADYKEKLSGATPEEARKRIDTLELQVKALSPRRLTNEQKQMMSRLLSSVQGIASVSQDMAVSDAKGLAADIAVTFQSAGWGVALPMIMGVGNSPRSGLALRVNDIGNLTKKQAMVKSALETAGIVFELQGGLLERQTFPQRPSGFPSPPQEPNPDVEILITTKVD